MKYLAPGVAVIGRYEPEIFNAKTIGEHLLKLTEELKLESYEQGGWSGATWLDWEKGAEVREPYISMRYAGSQNDVAKWHHDNRSSSPGMYMVLWSNREQTEIKLPDGTILRADPGDVLLVSNDEVQHRTPIQVSNDRWFFRRFVQKPNELS